jgi:hypothetical protein
MEANRREGPGSYSSVLDMIFGALFDSVFTFVANAGALHSQFPGEVTVHPVAQFRDSDQPVRSHP